jgi:hypothetical protein
VPELVKNSVKILDSSYRHPGEEMNLSRIHTQAAIRAPSSTCKSAGHRTSPLLHLHLRGTGRVPKPPLVMSMA